MNELRIPAAKGETRGDRKSIVSNQPLSQRLIGITSRHFYLLYERTFSELCSSYHILIIDRPPEKTSSTKDS